MTRELLVHSHLLVGSMTLHLMVCLQRLVVFGSLDGIPKMGVIDAGTGVLSLGGIVSLAIFVIFIIKKIRRKIPKLVFVCIVVFNIVVDIGGAALFCAAAFMGLTPNKNVHMFACGCLVTIGVTVVVEAIAIVFFFIFKVPGLKSFRPAQDSDDDGE